MQNGKSSSGYLQHLPKPNPIQSKTLVEPRSILPMLPLPNFNYSSELIDLASGSVLSQKTERHILPNNQLSELFAKPLFQANKRYNPKANNLNFATLQAFYSESGIHPPPSSQAQLQNGQELLFESRFESGNLAYVTKGESERQYFLLLQKDINTSRCTQWFFFRVQNKQILGTVRFHLINFAKPYSAFENGMRVAYCSKSKNYTWSRGCDDISYLKNNIKVSSNKNYFTLSFSFTFQNINDTIYLAHSPPYTFSMLDRHLLSISNNQTLKHLVKRKTLTQSPGGNYVDMLTITNFANKRNKKIVFITSRVHPGQTPASFVCQGLIDFLVSNCEEARRLRDNFIFKIVPMLNPDGVINGSYRCSLSGYDLNRVWHLDNKRSSPEVYFTKRAILDLEECFIFIDLHAHSKKKGVFMYGCQNRNSPYISRHIPYLLWKDGQFFNYYQCNFAMRQGREGTARLTVHSNIGLLYSYTMEHSFCSPVKEKYHFTAQHYEEIGQSICQTLRKYFCIKEENHQIFKELYNNRELLQVGANEDGDSSQDSQLDEPREFQELKPVIRRKPSVGVKTNRPPENTRAINSASKIPLGKTFSVNLRKTKRNTPQQVLQSFLSRNLPTNSPKRRLIGVSDEVVILKGEEREEINDYFQWSSRRKNEQEEIDQKIELVSGVSRFGITPRYHIDEVQGLNNLFLPSLTSASYKRYSKKISDPKNLMQVGRKYLQSTGIIKEEIKSVSRRKGNLREQALSYI